MSRARAWHPSTWQWSDRQGVSEWRERQIEAERAYHARTESHADVVRRCFFCVLRMTYDAVLDAWDCANCGWRAVDAYFEEREATRRVDASPA